MMCRPLSFSSFLALLLLFGCKADETVRHEMPDVGIDDVLIRLQHGNAGTVAVAEDRTRLEPVTRKIKDREPVREVSPGKRGKRRLEA